MDVIDDVRENPRCPVCDDDADYLGALGVRCHFRCRRCGDTFSAVFDINHLIQPKGEDYAD